MSEIKRLVCNACLRPQRACICRWVTPIDTAVEVLILQHPMEASQAKGSARLLHMSLVGSRLAVGENFSHDALQAMLYAPFESAATGDASPNTREPVLLYPSDPDSSTSTRTVPENPTHIRLVVLDGTWRKTRKMLYLNPELQKLPRLPLSNLPPSRYLIRKAHRPDQLSTLEAACHALTQLEKSAAKYEPLLHAFDGFVAQQEAHISRR